MPAIAFTLGEESLVLLVLGLVFPAIVIGIKTYFETRNNHKCIRRVETKLDLHEERAIEKEQEIEQALEQKDKETRAFFVDWIQRLENVTRDRVALGTAQGTALGTATTIEVKIDKLVEAVNNLVKHKQENP